MSILLVTLLIIYKLSNAVQVTPNNVATVPYIDAKLLSPGNVVKNNEWHMVRPINAWGIALTLDGEVYGFQPGVGDSSVSITVDMECTGECDAFHAFSIGDRYYSTWMHDMDGALYGYSGSPVGGIFTAPKCGSGDGLKTGNPAELLNGANDDWNLLRTVMASGSVHPFLENSKRVNTGPVTFEFINDDIADTFTIKFTSPSYTTPFVCTYAGAAPTCLDFIFYQTPDAGDKASLTAPQRIKSFDVSSTNTGWVEECTASAEVGTQCVASEERVLEVEFTVESSSDATQTATVYYNNKVYRCTFAGTTTKCSTICPPDTPGCAPLNFLGNDCNNDHAAKLSISNPTTDYAIYSGFKITTINNRFGNTYGADAFCGTGTPNAFEIKGTKYGEFRIDASTECGNGLLSNYDRVCVGTGVCSPDNLVVTFDTSRPNVNIQNALIEDNSDLNTDTAACCNDNQICCDDSQCCGADVCQANGKCGSSCNEEMRGEPCQTDNECSACMVCCKDKNVCHSRPN